MNRWLHLTLMLGVPLAGALNLPFWSSSTMTSSIPAFVGETALHQVKQIASQVATRSRTQSPGTELEIEPLPRPYADLDDGSSINNDDELMGIGGMVMTNPTSSDHEKQVWTALAKLERDS